MYAPFVSKMNSDRVPKNAFWYGLSTLFDISPKRRRFRRLSDQEALASDWHAIGRDFTKALRELNAQ